MDWAKMPLELSQQSLVLLQPYAHYLSLIQDDRFRIANPG